MFRFNPSLWSFGPCMKNKIYALSMFLALLCNCAAPEDDQTASVQASRNASGCPTTDFIVAEVVDSAPYVIWGSPPHPLFPPRKITDAIPWSWAFERIWFRSTYLSSAVWLDVSTEEVGDWLERNSGKGSQTLTNLSRPDRTSFGTGAEWGVYWQNSLPTLSWTTQLIEMRTAAGLRTTRATSRTSAPWLRRPTTGAYDSYSQYARVTCLNTSVLTTPLSQGAGYADSVTAGSVRVYKDEAGCWRCQNL